MRYLMLVIGDRSQHDQQAEVNMKRKQFGLAVGCTFLVSAALLTVTLAQTSSFDGSKAEELMELAGPPDEATDMMFSPDGKFLAVGSGSRDTGIFARTWNLEQGRIAAQLKGHQKTVMGVAYSADGKTLATIADDYFLKIWDNTGKELSSFNLKCNGSVGDLIMLKDNRALVACKTLKIVNLKNGQVTGQFKDISLAYRLAMPSDQTSVLVSTGDNDFSLLDMKTLERYRTLKGESQGFPVSYSSDGKLAATGSSDNTARVWNPANGKASRVLKFDLSVNDVALSPNGKILAVALDSDEVKLIDTASGDELKTLEHEENVVQLAWSKDGKKLASGDEKGIIKIWGNP
jgi:WD40 repeat protein